MTSVKPERPGRMPGAGKIALFGRGALSDMMSGYIEESGTSSVIAYIESGVDHKTDVHRGKPLIDLAQVPDRLERDSLFYVAVGYSGLNSIREKYYQALKDMGYSPYSFLHPSASISSVAKIGEHVWVLENAALQYMSEIGENSVIHMGVNIAHHSSIGPNCFIAQGSNVCGYVTVGRNCFVGAGAIIHNNLTIGNNCVIGAGAIVKGDIPDDSYVTGADGRPKAGAREYFEKWLDKVRSRL